MIPFIINPLAAADLIVGSDSCEKNRSGSGIEFLLSVDEVFTQIRQEPERYGKEFEEIRIAPIRRFQYAIAYRVDGVQITIVAIYHLRSDPRKWQSRA